MSKSMSKPLERFSADKFEKAKRAYIKACASKAMTEYPKMLEDALSIANNYMLWDNKDKNNNAGTIHAHTAKFHGDHISVVGTDDCGEDADGFVTLSTLNEYQHVNIDELDYCPACHDENDTTRKYE
jgi:hypothetical protein